MEELSKFIAAFGPEGKALYQQNSLFNVLVMMMHNGTMSMQEAIIELIKITITNEQYVHDNILHGPPPKYILTTQEHIDKIKETGKL